VSRQTAKGFFVYFLCLQLCAAVDVSREVGAEDCRQRRSGEKERQILGDFPLILCVRIGLHSARYSLFCLRPIVMFS